MLMWNFIVKYLIKCIIDHWRWVCCFTLYIYIYIYIIYIYIYIYIFVEYKLTANGRFVDRLPYSYGWVDDLRLASELPHFLLCLESSSRALIRVSFFIIYFPCFDEIITQYVEIWDLHLVMYYDTCDMAILDILLFVDEMVWFHSDVSFEKLFMHVLD